MTKSDLLEIGVKLLGGYLVIQGLTYLPITIQMIFDGVTGDLDTGLLFYLLFPTMGYVLGGIIVWKKASRIISTLEETSAVDQSETSFKWDKLDVFHVLLLLGCAYYAFDSIILVFQMIVDKSFFLRSEPDFRSKYQESEVSITVFKAVFSIILLFYSHLLIDVLRKKPGA